MCRVIAPEQRTPEVIREAVREVLGNPSYHERAQRLREEIQRLPEPEYAVALLEKLVAGNTSQVRVGVKGVRVAE